MQQQGFLASLFDLDFRSLVITRVIKVLYVLAMVFWAFYTVFFIVAGFNISSGAGLVFLILSPLFFLLGVVYARVLLEVGIIIFRIYETADAILGQMTNRGSGGVATNPPIPPVPPTSAAPEDPQGT